MKNDDDDDDDDDDEVSRPKYAYFYLAQLKTIDTAPWPHCLNKNVFSNRLNWPYDSPHSLRLDGRLFQTCGPAVTKVLSPKLLRVRLTTSLLVSAECSWLTRAADCAHDCVYIST